MGEMSTLHDALVDEVRDLYHAEKQLVKALPGMAKAASSDELREAIESHLTETEGHVTRLEQVFSLLDLKPRAKACAGMAGILEEGEEVLKDANGDSAVTDARIIASAQRVEHYEMAAYGTAAAWADSLGLEDVAELLHETLEEERAADQTLSALAETGINAAAGGDDEMEEDEDSDDASGRA